MLSLILLGHGGWLAVQLVSLLGAALCVPTLGLLLVGRRDRTLVLPTALLVAQSALTIAVGRAHTAIVWGRTEDDGQTIRLLGFVALVPLVVDLLAFAASRLRRRRLGEPRPGLSSAVESTKRWRWVGNGASAGGAVGMVGWFEDLSTGTPMPGRGGEVAFLIAVSALLLAVATIVLAWQEAKRSSRTAGGLTYKRAFERFPGALVFGADEGAPLLVNEQMRRILAAHGLSAALSPSQIWEHFADDAAGRAPDSPKISCRSVPIRAVGSRGGASDDIHGSRLLVGVGDEVWSLAYTRRADSDSSFSEQIWGEDITAEYALIRQIAEENTRLRDSAARLQESIDEAASLVEEQDLVGTRLRLHDVLAQRLVFVRRFLAEGVGQVERLRALSAMLASIGDDLSSSGRPTKEARLEGICSGCELIGASCVVAGALPANERVADVMLSVLRQAVTNAVLHAKAERIDVVFSLSEGEWVMSVSNAVPQRLERIVEKTGLPGMRSRVEALGGTLEARADDAFTLVVRVPAAHGTRSAHG